MEARCDCGALHIALIDSELVDAEFKKTMDTARKAQALAVKMHKMTCGRIITYSQTSDA